MVRVRRCRALTGRAGESFSNGRAEPVVVKGSEADGGDGGADDARADECEAPN